MDFDTLPGPPRTWRVGPHAEHAARPLEPGEEVVIANESGRRLRLAVAPDAPGRLDPERFAAIAEECDRLADALAALRAERDRARSDCHAIVGELAAAARRHGRLAGVLVAVADRLDYLQGLWGKEAITDRMASAIRAALAAADGPDDDIPTPTEDAPRP